MELRIELFVRQPERSADFYRRVLGFEVRRRSGDYIMLLNGKATVSLNMMGALPEDHPAKLRAGERPGRGVEVVLSVADVDAAYALAKASGWPLSEELATQPWGLVDFRLVDPDGYYLRITDRYVN